MKRDLRCPRLLLPLALSLLQHAAVAHAQGPPEQDRRAILAMAGEFAVSFDFEETVALRSGYALRPPSHSGGTELVLVVEDSGTHIALQHILVLGEEHTVVKHWRQDWTYEAPRIWEFRGGRRWEQREAPLEETRGAWQQAVFEVDDSPRYASNGRWVHRGKVSIWSSAETWRPLPRREYTQRSDYDVLLGINRHIITPQGWVHEQTNAKLDSSDQTGEPLLARESGLNTYRRIGDYDFSAGRDYWRRTSAFWEAVRADWSQALAGRGSLQVKSMIDGKLLAERMFELAEQDGGDGHARRAARRLVEKAVAASRTSPVIAGTTDITSARHRRRELTR